MSLILTGKKKRNDGGYFRVGHVVFELPPESIETGDDDGLDEVIPLRGRNPMYQRTGQARFDCTVRWKAVLLEGSSDPWSEWNNVRTLLAIFKCAPFVEVENGYLRQMLCDSGDFNLTPESRMAFALRQLAIDTVTDSPGTLNVALTMSLFNFRPYSVNFGYQGSANSTQPVSADESQAFKDYVTTWMGENLGMPVPFKDAAMAKKFGYPETIGPWQEQKAGAVTLYWREYEAVAAPLPGVVSAVIPPNATTGPVGTGSALFNAIAAAIQKQEGWVPIGTNPKFPKGSLSWRNNNPGNLRIPGSKMSEGYTSFDSYTLGYQALLNDIQGKFNTYGPRGWTFQQFFNRYAPSQDNNNPTQYTQVVVASLNKTLGSSFTPQTTLASMLSGTSGTPATFAASSPFQNVSSGPVLSSDTDSETYQAETISQMIGNDWETDHSTERATFLFKQNQIDFSDSELAETGTGGLYPIRISTVFVNNLAQQRLRFHPYPTYQHVGPSGVRISIDLMSEATQFDEEEPNHDILQQVIGMQTHLKNQFSRLRGEWRAVSSVHRMQAVIVQNQFLNMLGIFGTMSNGMSTETVDESPVLVQASLSLFQYENVFEEIEPFRAKGLSQPYIAQWNDILDDNNTLKSYTSDGSNTGLYKPLLDFQTARRNKDRQYLIAKLSAMPAAIGAGPPGVLSLPEVLVQGGVPESRIPTLNNIFGKGRIDPVGLVNLLKDDSLIPGIYGALFPWLYTNDPLFQNAINSAETNGPVKKAMAAVVPADAPGKAPGNANHGAYRDMGLRLITSPTNGADFNPGIYFVDQGLAYQQQLAQYTNTATSQAMQVTASFSRPTAGSTPLSIQTDGVPNPDASNIAGTISQTNIPSLSMARAFPTFKLFLIEEANDRPYVMFDNFYSYGSVLSIEIIKYRDQPDTAVLQITNFASLLSHKIFDGSAAGRAERKLSNLQSTPTSSIGPVSAPGAPVTAITAQKSITGAPMQLMDLRAGVDDGNGKMVGPPGLPLQFYALQPGSKIQVRMGFANNPDELWPVFTGRVSQVEGEEVLTVVCQSYLLELMDSNPEDLARDGFINPAYGGMLNWTETGDTGSVIGSVLKTSSAKHFGHWQVGSAPAAFLQGWSWTQLAAAAATATGFPAAGSVLATGYDRRGENIRINSSINADGSKVKNRLTRSWNYERPFNFLSARYHVPKDASITPWKIITDVGRRYPEYILSVRQYGFPYGADATLVFAQPNDCWSSRRELAVTAEQAKMTPTDNETFRTWWLTIGQYNFRQAADQSNVNLLQQILFFGLNGGLDKTIADITQGGYPAFQNALKLYTSFAANTPALFNLIRLRTEEVASAQRFQKAFSDLNDRFQLYLSNAIAAAAGKGFTARPNDRIQPVRRWHLITQDNIISNDIKLNDQIFNTVRIDDTLFPANAGIPHQYQRILDCDKIIVDVKQNVAVNGDVKKAYAQSFLREEVGKMYTGELVLTGVPEIEPWDVVLLQDPVLGMSGPIEVDTVIQAFDQENGYITIIKPRALVVVNEAVTAGICAALADLGRNLSGELNSVVGSFITSSVKAATGTAAAFTGAAAGAVAAGVPTIAGVATGTAVIGGGVVLGVLAAAAGIGFFWLADEKQGSLPVFVCPLARYNRPWVAGLEGYALEDLHTALNTKLQRFNQFEIQPTIESYKLAAQTLATIP